MNFDKELDARGLNCPLPILRTKKALAALQARAQASLRGEGIEPVLVNWALHREVRVLTALAFARGQRQPQDAVFSAHKVWDKRKPLLLLVLTNSLR